MIGDNYCDELETYTTLPEKSFRVMVHLLTHIYIELIP